MPQKTHKKQWNLCVFLLLIEQLTDKVCIFQAVLDRSGNISGPSPESEPRRPPEDCFEAFQAPARKMSPGDLQRFILKHFGPQPGK